MIEEVRLGSRHFEHLKRMSARYPVAMREDDARLQSKLANLESTRFNMSWILLAEQHCVGYLVAYPRRTLVDVPHYESVIYVDDLQVVKGYERYLFRLLTLLAKDIHRLQLEKKSIEGVCRRDAYKLFDRHRGVIERLGWEQVATYEYWDDDLGEELSWMRWNPRRTSQLEERDKVQFSDEVAAAEERPKLVTLDDADPMEMLDVLEYFLVHEEQIKAPLYPPVAGIACLPNLPGVEVLLGRERPES